jgi:hypothetical protein
VGYSLPLLRSFPAMQEAEMRSNLDGLKLSLPSSA